MKKSKVSSETTHSNSRSSDIEMKEGGATAGDPDQLFNDFRKDVKKRIE